MSEYQEVVKEGAKSIGKKIRRFFMWLLLLAVIIGAGYVGVCSYNYSKGTRAGTLTKVSYKGYIFKTYEGELNLGGLATDAEEGLSGNIWKFSVWQDDIYETLQDYQGQKVKLYYKQKIRALPWQGKTDYFVYRVDLVSKIDVPSRTVEEENQ